LRTLRTAGSFAIVALFLVLASGRLLHTEAGPPGYVGSTLGPGLLLLSAALAVAIQRNRPGSWARAINYCICVLLVLSVQLTGGFGGFLYPSLLLFLMWLSLPSIEGSATEMGLVIGFTQALALLNSTIWSGQGTFVTRILPLLLPALRSLLVPFIFGLTADWLSEKEFPGEAVAGRRVEKVGREPHRGLPSSPRSITFLVELFHSSGSADSTCLFLRDPGGYFRMAESASGDRTVIARFMLPPEHRLSKLALGGEETVIVRADSREEIEELSPYRMPSTLKDGAFCVMLCPFSSQREGNVDGFVLQDFFGRVPTESASASLMEFARLFSDGRGSSSSEEEDQYSWTARLVAACSEESLESSVSGMAGILAEIIPGSTVSFADVDTGEGRTSIRVSRGPLAGWRKGRVFSSSDGVAGWIVRNRVPCRRSRLSQGERSVGCFSSSDEHAGRTGSIMGVPVVRQDSVIALITVEHEDDEAFSQLHESILTAVAGLFSLREELAGLRNRFRNISGRDILTGLPGITLLSQHLQHMAKMVQTFGWYVGVLVADIDGFEAMNREIGYHHCDRLLKTASVRFRNCFSDEVFLARIGPDSFAACIPRTGKAVMEAMCQRAADSLSFEFSTPETSVTVTASVGGVYTHVNRKVLLLTQEAEEAMVQARSASAGSCLVRKLEAHGRERSSE